MRLKLGCWLVVATTWLSGHAAHAQVCGAGSVQSGSTALIGPTCTPAPTSAGVALNQLGLKAALSSQALCTNTACPSGTYLVLGYLEVTQAATLGTVQATLAYTDDGGARIASAGPSGSLTTPTYLSIVQVVRLNGTTGISVSTTLGGLTGTPTYNLFMVAILLSSF